MSNHAHLNVRRAVGAAGLAVGLAVGGYGIASAASGSTSTTSPQPTGQQPAGQAPTRPFAGPRMGRGERFGSGGTITSIAPDSVTVQLPDGTTRTIATAASTTYRKDGSTTSRSDLAVGQRIAVRETGTAPSATAGEIDIISPRLSGTVTGSGESTITISDDQGFSRTIHVTGSTAYDLGGQPATAAAVTAGKQIVAVGTIDANKTDLDATKVSVVLPRVAGVVQSVSGNTITLQGHDGTTVKVTTAGSTVYRNSGGQASASDVKQGEFIVATGERQPDGILAATSVEIGPAGGPGAMPEGPGGPGGPGGPQGRFRDGAGFGPGFDSGAGTSTGGAGLA